ncbi:MAG: hypothetical protein K2I96_20070 [Lachnospiraceae bacterium]|nr:hypothetical protein [Lachnospiraceae bacterium]
MTKVQQTMNRFIRRLKIRRKYKDALFRRCFEIYERGLKAEGKAEGQAEYIIELLEDVGEVPEALKNLIMRQTNLETLSKWHKLAAGTQSIEHFEKAIGLVNSDFTEN